MKSFLTETDLILITKIYQRAGLVFILDQQAVTMK